MTADTSSHWRRTARDVAGRHKPLHLRSLLKDAAAGWMDHNAMGLSAALSFYTILALGPLLVITIKVAGVLWWRESARVLIGRQMTSLMGPQAADAVGQMIETGGRRGAGVLATTVSTAVLLFSAAGVLVELRDGLNTVWGAKPGAPAAGVRAFVRTRLLSLAMVAGIGLLLLASVVVSATLAAAATYVAGDKGWLVILADVVVSFGVVVVLFAAVFKLLPDVRLAWRHVWLGAVITAALFTAGKYALALYFKYATPTSAFGAAGSLAAVLLWVYYSAFSLFFGAEFTRVWAQHHHGWPAMPGIRAASVKKASS